MSCECDLHNGWSPADIKDSLQLQVRCSPGSSSCHTTVPQLPHQPCFLPNCWSTRKWNKAAEHHASSSPLSFYPISQGSTSSSSFSPFISYTSGIPEWGPAVRKQRTHYTKVRWAPLLPMPPAISLFCVSTVCGERQPFLNQTEITSLMLEMFYPKGGFTRESYLNQKFHWAVLSYSKGDLCQGFLRGIESTSWGGFGSHLCGHP